MKEKNKEKAYQGCGLALVALVLLLCGCKSIEYVPVVQKETHTDSIYLTKVQRDSIWLHDSIRVEAGARGSLAHQVCGETIARHVVSVEARLDPRAV